MTIIAAITRDRAIGRGGDMLYHISADLRRFKALTMGHPLVMGRRTFESFPNGPLPGRRNLVVTRNAGYHPQGVEVYIQLDQALAAAGEDAYILGGGDIYAQTMSKADRLAITEIDSVSIGADTYFPEIDPSVWHPESVGEWLIDQRSAVRFRFVDYIRFA